jgi:hypothetical protein
MSKERVRAMKKMRGNLQEGADIQGTGVAKPPKGSKALRGGEVIVRDDIMRSPADKTKTPPPGKASKFSSSTVPGKTFTGRGGARKGRKMTGNAAAAILGKRY